MSNLRRAIRTLLATPVVSFEAVEGEAAVLIREICCATEPARRTGR
jgi:hypothetical protein